MSDETPNYLVTNPVHNCFKKIHIQFEYKFYTDLFDDFKVERVPVPLKIYKIPKSNNPKDYKLDLKY